VLLVLDDVVVVVVEEVVDGRGIGVDVVVEPPTVVCSEIVVLLDVDVVDVVEDVVEVLVVVLVEVGE